MALRSRFNGLVGSLLSSVGLDLRTQRAVRALFTATAIAGAGGMLAGCSTTSIGANGMEYRQTVSPFGATTQTRMNVPAVHQNQIEVLCAQADGQLRRVGVQASLLASDEVRFRLERERALLAADQIAGVPQQQRSNIAGTCATILSLSS